MINHWQMGRPKDNYYWTDDTQQAVLDYINESDERKRSIIYEAHIHPKLITMSGTILKRYFYQQNNLHQSDVSVLVNDAVSSVVENGFKNYDKTAGSSFSYFQTAIKHFFYDRFYNGRTSKLHKLKNMVDIDLTIDEADMLYNYEIDHSTMEDLRGESKEYVKKKMSSTKLTPRQKKVLKVVYELFTMKNYNRHFSTYFLMKNTGMSQQHLRIILNQFNLEHLCFSHGQYHRGLAKEYKNVLEKYLILTDGNVIEAFNLYADDIDKEKKRKSLEMTTLKRESKKQ